MTKKDCLIFRNFEGKLSVNDVLDDTELAAFSEAVEAVGGSLDGGGQSAEGESRSTLALPAFLVSHA